MRKLDFAYAKTMMQISCAVTAQLISAFVFATWLVQSLYLLNPKFQASSLFLFLYSPLVGNPKGLFSHNAAHMVILGCTRVYITVYILAPKHLLWVHVGTTCMWWF